VAVIIYGVWPRERREIGRTAKVDFRRAEPANALIQGALRNPKGSGGRFASDLGRTDSVKLIDIEAVGQEH